MAWVHVGKEGGSRKRTVRETREGRAWHHHSQAERKVLSRPPGSSSLSGSSP